MVLTLLLKTILLLTMFYSPLELNNVNHYTIIANVITVLTLTSNQFNEIIYILKEAQHRTFWLNQILSILPVCMTIFKGLTGRPSVC